MREAWQGPLEKIDEYRWRIPKSHDPGMRVPGLIFADERLLKDIRQDQAMQQVVNVAHLPGIVRHSLAMPDIHWGYGFPIGGVAATDPDDKGVVSPGGVGFDINCLSGDTRVLHRFGYSRTIAEIVHVRSRDAVRCYALGTMQPQAAKVAAVLYKRPTTPVMELITVGGRRIIATTDHPFLTPEGMRSLETLQPGDSVAIDPFEGVPYEEAGDEVLIDEARVRRWLQDVGKSGGNAVPQIIHELQGRQLLPLRRNSPALPVLLKALGFVMGDGTLYFERGTRKGMTWFFGKAEDLELIRRDLTPWFTVSQIYTRRRAHQIQTDYGLVKFEATNACCRVSSSAFAVLLALLGCPVGNKSLQDYEVPAWLFRAPRWQKRLFLAPYFGAELQMPHAYAVRARNFPCPLLTVQKQEHHAASGRRFLEQIAQLAREFGAEPLGIEEHRETVVQKRGVSHRLRLSFSSRPESLVALYARIGIEYHQQKRSEAAAVTAYQTLKQVAWGGRQTVLSQVMKLRETTGFGAKRIASVLAASLASGSLAVNMRFIERTLYGRAHRTVRVPEGFKDYPAFRREATEGLGQSGLIWERIQSIRARDDIDRVYDISVAHPDHNFVANQFVVHNCGVRLIKTNLMLDEVQPKLRQLVRTLFDTIPCGVGMSGDITVNREEHREVMTRGSRWIVEEKGYGVPEDLEHTESRGAVDGAEPSQVSSRAYQRGHDQLGTLGSGNHFLEVQVVDTVFDDEAAQVFGLQPGQVTVMMHSGSRGFGYQVCDDYLDVVERAMHRYGITVPDRQLACVPVHSEEGRAYLGAMRCAANYAWANRQCLMHLARKAFMKVFGKTWQELGLRLIYDVAHNIAKLERHKADGHEKLVLVHRKGATRAFPPNHPEIPKEYQSVGQPVIIPGDMGRNSYLLVGTDGAMEQTFGTVCHGAGRAMSRAAAVKDAAGRSIEKELEQQGIIVMGRGRKGIAEEQPKAYKDVNDVVRVVHHAGLAKRVARMRPLGAIKG